METPGEARSDQSRESGRFGQRGGRQQGCPHGTCTSRPHSSPLLWKSSYSFRPHESGLPVALTVPAQVMGLIVSGDVAGYTIYTDMRGRKVAFPVAPPKEPPSPPQIAHRERFRQAVAAYLALSAEQRATLELCVQRASLALTGLNLYIAIALKNQTGLVETLERQTDLSLPAIPYIHYPP